MIRAIFDATGRKGFIKFDLALTPTHTTFNAGVEVLHFRSCVFVGYHLQRFLFLAANTFHQCMNGNMGIKYTY